MKLFRSAVDIPVSTLLLMFVGFNFIDFYYLSFSGYSAIDASNVAYDFRKIMIALFVISTVPVFTRLFSYNQIFFLLLLTIFFTSRIFLGLTTFFEMFYCSLITVTLFSLSNALDKNLVSNSARFSVPFLVFVYFSIILTYLYSYINEGHLFYLGTDFVAFFSDRISIAFLLTTVFFLSFYSLKYKLNNPFSHVHVLALTVFVSIFVNSRVFFACLILISLFNLRRFNLRSVLIFFVASAFVFLVAVLTAREEFLEISSRLALFEHYFNFDYDLAGLVFGSVAFNTPILIFDEAFYSHNWLVSGFFESGLLGLFLHLSFLYLVANSYHSRLYVLTMLFFFQFHNGLAPFTFSIQFFFILGMVFVVRSLLDARES